MSLATGRLWLRVGEAAELVGLGKTTINAAIRRGDLHVARVGRAVRVPVEELRRWASAQADRSDQVA
jgi:excisionase family DNA binding protein